MHRNELCAMIVSDEALFRAPLEARAAVLAEETRGGHKSSAKLRSLENVILLSKIKEAFYGYVRDGNVKAAEDSHACMTEAFFECVPKDAKCSVNVVGPTSTEHGEGDVGLKLWAREALASYKHREALMNELRAEAELFAAVAAVRLGWW